MGFTDVLSFATPAPGNFSFSGDGSSSSGFAILSRVWPRAEDRIAFTKHNFYTEFAPWLLGFYTLAVLVQLPNTRTLRMGVLAVMVALGWHLATAYEYAEMPVKAGDNWVSFTVCWLISFWMLRAIDFATSDKLFKRIKWSNLPDDAPQDFQTQLKGALLNAPDLCFNGRGIGWNWGKNIYTPPQTSSTGAPVAETPALDYLYNYIKVQIFFDFVLFAQQTWTLYPAPGYAVHPAGGTIFDPTLPWYLFAGKCVAMTILCPVGLCSSFAATYYIVAFLCITLLGQSSAQWPPLFQEPWRATSLADYWGTRWHQVFKRSFVVCGAKPAARLFGRAGGVIGAFFVSGVMHDTGVWGAGLGTDPGSITMFFTMMGVGCVLEEVWKQKTGRKVGGVLGWAWAMIWMLYWGSFIIDAWARRGLIISKMSADAMRPSLYWAKVVQRWIELNGQPPV
ncbi:hypothetical protein FA95DRAFT_511623 [Auriscalpium vulgare]|uniref:Uncharacterized protein n=1 Tax=Auriscalpium vulgare TaxID=40419 RepID=A0ACB8RH77_9AGAM|nr:hypothetical protein FA95DRAFT_511623 [Auriscalpium vulgare]